MEKGKRVVRLPELDSEFQTVEYNLQHYHGVPGHWFLLPDFSAVTNDGKIRALDGIYWCRLAREDWERRGGRGQ